MSKKAEKLEEIIAVVQQVFSKKGYYGTSILDIAEALSINKASVYHYFASKEEMAIAAVQMLTRKCQKMFENILNTEDSGEEKIEALRIATDIFSKQEPQAAFVLIFVLECNCKETEQLRIVLKKFFELWYQTYYQVYSLEYEHHDVMYCVRDGIVFQFSVFVWRLFFAEACAHDFL